MIVIFGAIPNSWQAPGRKSEYGLKAERYLATFQRRELCGGGGQSNDRFTWENGRTLFKDLFELSLGNTVCNCTKMR